MARRVKARKAKPAVNRPIRAIAVVGRFKKGSSGSIAFQNTPRIIATKNLGKGDIRFQKSCMILFDEAFLRNLERLGTQAKLSLLYHSIKLDYSV
jgi:hypothetical protein